MKHYKDIKALGEACWQGYRQEGMKKKGDRQVPNCVPDDAPLGEAKGIPNPNTYPDQNPRPVQGDHRIAPPKAKAAKKSWWKVVKSPAGMPKGHTLIQWGDRYFCFTAEPKSQGQGETNPNWTKAAIWKCDKNGKRTHPTEDPVWDSKQGGWSAEEAMDRWLDSYADPYEALDEETQTQKGKKDMKNFKELRQGLGEATVGKPETMAQKHTRLMGYDGRGGTDYAYLDQKKFLTAVREFAKDWHSGDMALNRMQTLITFELAWLMRGPMATSTAVDPYTDLMAKLSAAFRKRVKSAGLEPTSRLGEGGGFKGSAMGKITPNQIGAYFDLVVDFVQNDWPKIAKSMGNPKRAGAAKAESPAVDIGG